jgi:hypothetical protein
MENWEIVAALEAMEHDTSFVTEPAYRANTVLWPGHSISFVETHTTYLKDHPGIVADAYLSNLRLRLRKRL